MRGGKLDRFQRGVESQLPHVSGWVLRSSLGGSGRCGKFLVGVGGGGGGGGGGGVLSAETRAPGGGYRRGTEPTDGVSHANDP